MQKSIEIFFCYAHEDEALRLGLEKQLRALRRQGIIDLWHDRDISAGTEWEREIDKHLNSAKIILLLVSPDFMDSDYCYSIEMKRAMERHEQGDARVIPVILRHVYWKKAPFGKLQPLPSGAIPVVSKDWYSQDEAFFSVAEGIRLAVEELTVKDEVKRWTAEGNRLREQTHYEEALADFDRAITLDANYVDAFYGRGETYRLMKKYQEALADFDRAIAQDANYADALASRGDTYRHLKRYQEALADFDRAIAQDANNEWNFTGRGIIYRQLERYQEALADFDRAIALNANNKWNLASRGDTYRHLKRYQDALTDFDRVISLDADFAWAIAQRKRVNEMLKA